MRQLKVIITDATGMVGEGVLLHCLQSDEIAEVLIINRKLYDLSHPKQESCLSAILTNWQIAIAILYSTV